tara:strand:+ start:6764 stop:8269 length:1506 start_codon:yes stop_codon:yes gene_type:complete
MSDEHADLPAAVPDASGAVIYPELPERMRGRGPGRLFRMMGPGLIIASVTIGSGELVIASRGGAIFSYAMLWCFFYGGAFKAVQVYTASRHFTLTGEHPLESWRQLPGPPMWFPLLVVLPAVGLMPIAFSAIPETLAGYIHRLSGLSTSGDDVGPWGWFEFCSNGWATLVLVVCLLLAVASNYDIVEKASIVVLGVLVGLVVIAVVVLGPDLREAIVGLVIPRVGDYPEWVYETPELKERFAGRSPWLEVSLYLTAVGGGAYDYIGYIGMSREKGWGLAGRGAVSREELASGTRDENTMERARAWSRVPLVDAVGSFACVILVTLLFAMLGAMVLHSKHAIPVDKELLIHQEDFLTALHPQLKWVFRGGVFLAFIGTLYGAFEVYRHTCREAGAVLAPTTTGRLSDRGMKMLVIGYCTLGGMTLTWLPQSVAGDIIGRLTLGSLVSGAATCGLWCFAMLWVDHFRMPDALRMSRRLKIVTVVAGVSMTALGATSIYKYFVP